MENKISVVFECNTVSELNQSWYQNRWSKSKRVRTQKDAVKIHLSVALRKLGGKFPLPARVTLTRISSRKLDVGDNLPAAFKAIRDEVAAVLGVDDGGDSILWCYSQEPAAGRPKSVRIEIEQLEEVTR